MTPVVIGEPGACLRLGPREGTAVAGWLATVEYEAGSVTGAFETEIIPGGADRWRGKFSDRLEAIHARLAGEAQLHSLEDELRVRLTCTRLGKVDGNVEIRLLPAGDPRAPRISFQVNLDQSYLPQTIAATRKNFPGI